MKTRSIILRFRRRRTGATDYRRRLRMLLSKKTRLVIRKSSGGIAIQLADYSEKGDKIITSAKASELKKYGWKCNTGNIPAAYLTGLLLAKKARNVQVGNCIADIGAHKSVKGSRVFAALKGALDGGIDVSCSKDNIPAEDRIAGKHIEAYASKVAGKSERMFSTYLKNNIEPTAIGEMFSQVKAKIKAES